MQASDRSVHQICAAALQLDPARAVFMIDQLPSGSNQVGELRLFHCMDDEALPGRIDIFAADLEHVVLLAKGSQPVQLLWCIAGRHVGNGVDPTAVEYIEELIQVSVLKFLRFLIAGHALLYVAEVGVAGDRIVFFCELCRLCDRDAFVGRWNIDFFDKCAFQDPEQIILIESILCVH